ncbi:MAG: nicotinate phosphoribosyltransferase [Proteobacteria bacterium]|nr:nicotinate phosphoribosyltransferase [Pseudomonadota bacterium]
MISDQKLGSRPFSTALSTDFYQLTMAYGYWKSGMQNQEGVFHLFFRRAPFNGRYSIACGLESVVEFIENMKFDRSDLEYLSSLQGDDGQALFEADFLDYLKNLEFQCDIDAVPEGTVMFPYEPLIRVRGPLIQCQILETPLLNLMNFPSLIATKAARICRATQGDPVLEFGMRRAQGQDGAMTASRAAYIGGCSATSNVMAGKVFGIPIKGTIAHSWVMAFEDEIEAFRAYADIMPNNCVLLVDTYSTLDGVGKAIEVGKQLKNKGYRLSGIRLDSGDLAYLSIESRKILDESGFPDVKIVASNDLDETLIQSLKMQKARIDIWGVGTKLVTAFDQPALDGVYKLSAIRSSGRPWQYKIKVSEQKGKVTTPGIQQVRRYSSDGMYMADAIYDIGTDLSGGCVLVDPFDATRRKRVGAGAEYTDLLGPVFRGGKRVSSLPSLAEIRKKVQEELNRFHPTILRLVNPHQYPVGNEKTLDDLKTELILKARKVQT